jgi:hypothetical protein
MTLSASIACCLIASHCNHLISIVYQATAVGAFQVALGGDNQIKDFLATITKLSPRELDEYLVSSSSFAVSMSTHHASSVDSLRCCVRLFGWGRGSVVHASLCVFRLQSSKKTSTACAHNRTVPIQLLFSSYSVPIQFLFSSYSVPIQFLFSSSSVPIQFLYSVPLFSSSIQFLYSPKHAYLMHRM